MRPLSGQLAILGGHVETGTARLAADTSGQRVGRDRRRNAFQGVGTDAVAGFVFSGAPVDKLLFLGRIERLEALAFGAGKNAAASMSARAA